MKAMVFVLLIAVVPATFVATAGAAAPTGPLEEAGRLVDELAGRLGSFGADLVQQIQQGRGAMGMPGRIMGDPVERPLITIMLHHRTGARAHPRAGHAARGHPRGVRAGGDPPGRRHPHRRARPRDAPRAGSGGPRQGRGQDPGGGAAPGRPPGRAAPRGRAGEGRAHRGAAGAPPVDAERRDAATGHQARRRRAALGRHRRSRSRAPRDDGRMTISKVGVVGCGLMGGGIAQVVAQSGYQTTVVEADQGLLDRGLRNIRRGLDTIVDAGAWLPTGTPPGAACRGPPSRGPGRPTSSSRRSPRTR